MFDIVYVNGRYLHRRRARISISDRGVQFADSVYELIALRRGRLIGFDSHLERLERSMDVVGIRPGRSRRSLALVVGETIRRNRVADALLYIQVSRGSAPRHHIPPEDMVPSLVVALYPPIRDLEALDEGGVRVVTVDDIRWQRCDVKSTALIANVLCKSAAARRRAFEAWMVEGGRIREGASSNAWIVDARGRLRTCPDDGGRVLAGIARETIFRLADALKIEVRREAFSRDDIGTAREAFLSSASCFLLPVVEVDGQSVGEGRPGPVTRSLRAAYEKTLAKAPRVKDLWRVPSIVAA